MRQSLFRHKSPALRALSILACARGTGNPALPTLLELLRQGNVWVMMSNGHRVSLWPGCAEVIPVEFKRKYDPDNVFHVNQNILL